MWDSHNSHTFLLEGPGWAGYTTVKWHCVENGTGGFLGAIRQKSTESGMFIPHVLPSCGQNSTLGVLECIKQQLQRIRPLCSDAASVLHSKQQPHELQLSLVATCVTPGRKMAVQSCEGEKPQRSNHCRGGEA